MLSPRNGKCLNVQLSNFSIITMRIIFTLSCKSLKQKGLYNVCKGECASKSTCKSVIAKGIEGWVPSAARPNDAL